MWRKILFLTLFSLFIWQGPVLAAEIYVDANSGSDAAAGTASEPLGSIQTALARAGNQDTIYVRGTSQYYYNFLDTLTITQEGLTISNWGDSPAYFNLLAAADTFDIQADNVTLTGLSFQESSIILSGSGVGASSINIGSGVTGTTVTNCSFLFGTYAVYSNGQNNNTAINNNLVSGNLMGAFTVNQSEGVEISGNEINIYNDSDLAIFYDIYVYQSSDVEITKNKIYETPASSAIALSSNEDTLVANNLVYNNNDITNAVYVTSCTDTYVYNNTFYNNYTGLVDYEDSNTNLRVKNNIFSNNYYGISLNSNSPSSYSNNLFQGNTCGALEDYSCQETIGSDSVTEAANFQDASQANFQLQSSSYAIDHGADLSKVTDDYSGLSRPYGDYYDLGAYEYAKDFTPKKIKNPAIKNKQTTQVKLKWDKRKTATKYYVKLMHKSGKKIKTYKKITKTSKILKNLKPGKTYKAKIRAIKVKNGITYKGKWSKIKKFTTPSQ